MSDEDPEAKAQREHQKEMAIIEARARAFDQSPFWFTVWDATMRILKISFWLSFWLIVAQCHCDCILKP